MNDDIERAIRTFVPIIIGTILTALDRRFGVSIDSTAAVSVTVPAVISGYYALAKVLENVNPAFGWLLGAPKATQ